MNSTDPGTDHSIADQGARERALDPQQSFIVQAPAGSGKTELLMQRFLVLLTGVDAPEEIIAITFTRKAAAEMRQRILQALKAARAGQVPESEHGFRTWQLARKVLTRDSEQGWRLLEYPARLRIQTIDSLGTALARQMPVLSQFGAMPKVAEDAQALYLETARNCLSDLGSDTSEWSDCLALLARHLDNRLDRVQDLIAVMLGCRDQWLRHLAVADGPRLERRRLEAAMASQITVVLEELVRQFPVDQVAKLVKLARFAALHLPEKSTSAISRCGSLESLPGSKLEDRFLWEGVAELLLTKAGTWRKLLSASEGFPAKSIAMDEEEVHQLEVTKHSMKLLLQSLGKCEGLREQLDLLRFLPQHRYESHEWKILQALIQILRLACAHLQLVFREREQVDFTALTLAAVQALGDPESPTDLALALDYRIRHLLVDEFQDTSFSQFELIARITAGWHSGDGHTLFIVGDPMQSIYRFREAEVGLFLAAARNGIGQVALHPLHLTVNFRSQQGIVDWVNHHFIKILPDQDDVYAGAVSYARSTPCHPALPGSAVSLYLWEMQNDEGEARKVVSLVNQARIELPQGSTAILVRARSSLKAIAAGLRRAGIRFRAVEIEHLDSRALVQDLLALVRALIHPGDRIAWLAVLRAPYCGLTLDDLHRLVLGGTDKTVAELLGDAGRRACLSEDGQARIHRVWPVLDAALRQRARGTLRHCVEGVWIALGGPACVEDRTGLDDAESFFQLLEKLEREGDQPEIANIEQEVRQLFAAPDVQADDSLQVMTIHKAKGLEFDTVILPGLSRAPIRDDNRLLEWLEFRDTAGENQLVLAPISAYGKENVAASYLKKLEQQKQRLEEGRLLYVAATRARKRLHLLGYVKHGRSGQIQAPGNSLLAHLYPHVSMMDIIMSPDTDDPDEVVRPKKPAGQPPQGQGFARMRLASTWELPDPPEAIQVPGTVPQVACSREVIKFEWAGETARSVGTVVHRLLQHVGALGVERITSPGDTRSLEQTGYVLLRKMAVPQDRIEAAYSDVCKALQMTLQDPRGRWVLSGLHDDCACELALSARTNGRIDHVVIDRTFVDAEGIRWIIDYKASSHKGAGLEEFLDQEQERYRGQLERYAGILARLEEYPVCLGLYFPLLKGWRKWSFSSDEPAIDSS